MLTNGIKNKVNLVHVLREEKFCFEGTLVLPTGIVGGAK